MEKNTITEIDETISVICKRIQDDACGSESYAETVKALAALVEARTKLDTLNIIFNNSGNQFAKAISAVSSAQPSMTY